MLFLGRLTHLYDDSFAYPCLKAKNFLCRFDHFKWGASKFSLNLIFLCPLEPVCEQNIFKDRFVRIVFAFYRLLELFELRYRAEVVNIRR